MTINKLAVVAIFLGYNNSVVDEGLAKTTSIIIGCWLGFIILSSLVLTFLNYKAEKGKRITHITTQSLDILVSLVLIGTFPCIICGLHVINIE